MFTSVAEILDLQEELEYPDSDGEPMAESDFQLIPLIYAITALRIYFQDRLDVYVAGDMLLYYEQANPKAVVAPDVFVVVGAPKRRRRSYLLWREPKAPDFILEITSMSTAGQDQRIKKGLYAFLGVTEYFQFDPTADYLNPPLQGFRLEEGRYIPIQPETSSNGTLRLYSEILGLYLELHGDEFRFVRLDGQKLLSAEELEAAHQAEAQARRAEEAARQAAEARIAELEAELRRLSGK
jgi:Uma2 family endonuclease